MFVSSIKTLRNTAAEAKPATHRINAIKPYLRATGIGNLPTSNWRRHSTPKALKWQPLVITHEVGDGLQAQPAVLLPIARALHVDLTLQHLLDRLLPVTIKPQLGRAPL